VQEYGAAGRRDLRFWHLPFSSALAFALSFALTPQQLPINLGDLFQVIFQLVVVLDPAADFFQLIRGNDSSGRVPWPERDREVPNRSMPFTFGAFARRIPAGYVSLYQRSPQNIDNLVSVPVHIVSSAFKVAI